MKPAEFKSIRNAIGLSQTEMGRRLGDESGHYSLRAVQSWEAGVNAIPHAVRVLARLMLRFSA